MERYYIEELKQAWKALYFTDCNVIWSDINDKLHESLGRIEYLEFVSNTEKILYLGEAAA